MNFSNKRKTDILIGIVLNLWVAGFVNSIALFPVLSNVSFHLFGNTFSSICTLCIVVFSLLGETRIPSILDENEALL